MVRCAYLGFNYKGFQVQPDVPTVQGVLQDALKKSGYSKSIRYASRTDAGVSAIDQIIILEHNDTSLLHSARSSLPADVKLLAYYIGSGSEFKLGRKEYLYISPLFSDVKIERLEKAAYYLSGRVHNYYQLIRRPSQSAKNPWMRVFVDFDITNHWIFFRVTGQRFYWEQVRRIVSLLLGVSMGRISFKTFTNILKGKQYKGGIPPAPPEGLILFKVETSVDEKFTCLEDRKVVEQWIIDEVKFKIEEVEWTFISPE